ncbi:MAG TPA: hypothetical protein VNQ77_14735 [Frankiaceae bacterium]|nr:hypothetical protein [Frankiaceae bacterium]
MLCGAVGVELHREDAIPLWVMELLGGPGDVWWTKDGAEQWLAPAFLVDTCRPCNDMMNRLYENHDMAQRVLPPLLVGSPVILSGKEQRFVADWLIKTSLMIDAAVPHDPRPDLLHHFHEHNFRLPDATVWIAKYEPSVVVTPHPPFDPRSPDHPAKSRIPPHEPTPRIGTPIGVTPFHFPHIVNNEPLAYVGPTRIGALVMYATHRARGLTVGFYSALDRLMFRVPNRGRVAWGDLPAIDAQGWADIAASVVWSGPRST